MAKFVVIGERIHCISPTIKKAMEEMAASDYTSKILGGQNPLPM